MQKKKTGNYLISAYMQWSNNKEKKKKNFWLIWEKR